MYHPVKLASFTSWRKVWVFIVSDSDQAYYPTDVRNKIVPWEHKNMESPRPRHVQLDISL